MSSGSASIPARFERASAGLIAKPIAIGPSGAAASLDTASPHYGYLRGRSKLGQRRVGLRGAPGRGRNEKTPRHGETEAKARGHRTTKYGALAFPHQPMGADCHKMFHC